LKPLYRAAAKGLYPINAVDCVTQWQIVRSVQAISEAFLVPPIDHMLAQFPFHFIGFHSDNGRESALFKDLLKRA